MSRLAAQSKVDYYFHHKEESLHCKGSAQVNADFMLGYVCNIMKLPSEKKFKLYSEGRMIAPGESMGSYAGKKIIILEE